mgnify:CR=1 FL=1
MRFSLLSISLMVLLFYSCGGSGYKKMSVENPEQLLSIQDSLLSVRANDQIIIDALVVANNNLAEKYMRQDKNVLAIDYFKKANELKNEDIISKYGLLISEGKILIEKGNKNGIWDAIEKFSKASTLYPDNGEPFYWTAISYTKLGDTDFDLILESYEKALSLKLDEKQRIEVEKKYEKEKGRKKKLDSFWK